MKKLLIVLIVCWGIGGQCLWEDSGLAKAQSASPQQTPFSLPNVPPKDLWIGTSDFSGGINNFLQSDRISSKESFECINLLPDGLIGLTKRSGYQKIFFTPHGAIHGITLGDSANVNPQLIVVAGDSIFWANSSSGWELGSGATYPIGTTTATIPHYFAATPFGTVVVNGTDSTRIWTGKQPYTGLGICLTDTCDTSAHIAFDTVRVRCIESRWTPDYWIGYWVKKLDGNIRQIIDNDVNSLVYIADSTGTDPDTIDRTRPFYIVCRPDSTSSTLTYPKGQASAYYDDRLFVSSAFYPWRIYYSNTRLINDIDPDAFINLDMGAFDQIQVMKVFNGYLIVFGKYSVYAIDNSLQATLITKVVGCIAPYSVAVGDDYIYFLSDRGVYRFKGNIYGSLSYTMEKISDAVNPAIDAIDPNNWANLGGHYGDKRYWMAVSPDTSLVFDERTNGWYKQSFGFTDILKYSGILGTSWSEELCPTVDGDTVEWTTSTGLSHFTLVNCDGITDYVYTGSNHFLDKFTIGNLIDTTTFTVNCLSVSMVAKKSATTSPAQVEVDMTGTDGKRYVLATFTMTTSWVEYNQYVYTNPQTSVPWTKTTINNLVVGIMAHTSSASVYVSSIKITPVGVGSFASTAFLFSKSTQEFVYRYGGSYEDDTATTEDNITGIPILASYKSGWFDGGNSNDQKIMRKFFIEAQKDTGKVSCYLYKDFGTTATDSGVIDKGGNRRDLFFMNNAMGGKKFQVEIKNWGDVDTLIIKGWSALLRTLGERKE